MTERSHHTPDRKCSEPGCPATFLDHRWGSIKAHGEGWFIQDTAAWCPKHIPDWVEEWRARRH